MVVVANKAVCSSDQQRGLDTIRQLEVLARQPVEGRMGNVVWDGIAGDGTVAGIHALQESVAECSTAGFADEDGLSRVLTRKEAILDFEQWIWYIVLSDMSLSDVLWRRLDGGSCDLSMVDERLPGPQLLKLAFKLLEIAPATSVYIGLSEGLD